jgi:hypothetical protein
MDQAAELISNCLSEKNLNLGPNGFVVKAIEEYLNSAAATDPSVLLKALQQIKTKDPDTMQAWQTLLGLWTDRYAKAKKLGNNDRASN